MGQCLGTLCTVDSATDNISSVYQLAGPVAVKESPRIAERDPKVKISVNPEEENVERPCVLYSKSNEIIKKPDIFEEIYKRTPITLSNNGRIDVAELPAGQRVIEVENNEVRDKYKKTLYEIRRKCRELQNLGAEDEVGGLQWRLS